MAKCIKTAVVKELHRSARKNFPRRHVILRSVDDLAQIDLIDMQLYSRFNSGYKYILVVINAFTKYIWVELLKTKNANDVTVAFEKILKKMKPICSNIQSYQGTEFYNKPFQNLLQKYGINHYSTFSHKKASIVERAIRSLKSKIWQEFHIRGSYKYLDFLPKIIENYNNTKHRTIGMKPKDVSLKHQKFLLNTVYNYENNWPSKKKKPKFRVGDKVRVSMYKNIFEKSYTANYSTEIFTIHAVKRTNPITYILRDYEDNIIKGGFYEFELQRTKYPDTFLVEKIIKSKGNNVMVKWLGFVNSHNSWISRDDIIN